MSRVTHRHVSDKLSLETRLKNEVDVKNVMSSSVISCSNLVAKNIGSLASTSTSKKQMIEIAKCLLTPHQQQEETLQGVGDCGEGRETAMSMYVIVTIQLLKQKNPNCCVLKSF